ncbi:hypothetical protein H0H92_000809 [Tricholoma furcatifolium]|nr:hypothetical protein H0H92_000809 [Tricholoma furcatifolium]
MISAMVPSVLVNVAAILILVVPLLWKAVVALRPSTIMALADKDLGKLVDKFYDIEFRLNEDEMANRTKLTSIQLEILDLRGEALSASGVWKEVKLMFSGFLLRVVGCLRQIDALNLRIEVCESVRKKEHNSESVLG